MAAMEYELGGPPTPNGTSNCAAGSDESKPPPPGARGGTGGEAVLPGGGGGVRGGEAVLAVGDERDVPEAGVDRGGGVLDVDDERRAAGHGVVGVAGNDAQVLAELRARHGTGAAGEDGIDLRLVDAGVA